MLIFDPFARDWFNGAPSSNLSAVRLYHCATLICMKMNEWPAESREQRMESGKVRDGKAGTKPFLLPAVVEDPRCWAGRVRSSRTKVSHDRSVKQPDPDFGQGINPRTDQAEAQPQGRRKLLTNVLSISCGQPKWRPRVVKAATFCCLHASNLLGL